MRAWGRGTLKVSTGDAVRDPECESMDKSGLADVTRLTRPGARMGKRESTPSLFTLPSSFQ
jgi:hypothetical protein